MRFRQKPSLLFPDSFDTVLRHLEREQKMHKLLARANQERSTEIRVGANGCRLARQGERLVARSVLADVVVTIQVPAAGFAAMLRFSAPDETCVSRPRLEALWDFADQALALVFESVRSMQLPAEQMVVSAIGGADVTGKTFGRGKQLALAVRRSLWKEGVLLKGTDLGGEQSRTIWLESSSGRLIVRSMSPQFDDPVNEQCVDIRSVSTSICHRVPRHLAS